MSDSLLVQNIQPVDLTGDYVQEINDYIVTNLYDFMFRANSSETAVRFKEEMSEDQRF